ncbi:efflux transporter outer membrane subunit [Rhodoferax sp.]|uniref:efflux transporter outer membrane subunit n=1 Tax=Rhodoferax sp. TaxID=50421 RepID=UPI00276F8A58|nr:efflux transporter outer membrane subunit [Rhodoferax sp.]
MNSTRLHSPSSLLALLAAACLSACSMIPSYQRPAAPVAEQWPAAATGAASAPVSASPSASTPTAPASDVAWQDFFADPSLRQLIDTALANNRDLRVAVLNIEQARAQLGIKRADQWPTLNAVATGSRTPTSSGGINSLYSAGVAVTAYELDFFGRVASLKEQALAQFLASTEGSRTARISLIASVAQSWLALLADEELLSISQQTLATREGSLKLVQLRFDYGATSELELRQAQSLLESARVTLAQQQRQRALDENALVLLLGQALPAEVRARLPSARLTLLRLPELPAGLPSDLLTRRPDIRQAEQQLLAANANIGAARAAFFPRISLTAGLGSASSALSGLFKDGAWGFTVAPQALLPLFDAGRNRAALASARVGFDIAVAQYEKSIQSAFREVADALAGRDTLAQQLQAQQAQLDAETDRLRLTDLRYQNGAASQLDWLDAQRSQFASQQALVQVRLAYLQNQVALYKTLGGGAGADTGAP